MEFPSGFDWVTVHAGQWHKTLVRFIGQPGLMVEIGTWEGRSAAWFAQNILTHERSHLLTVDPSPKPAAETNLAPFVGKITQIRSKSREFIPKLSDSTVSIAYVDGSHDGLDVLRDAVDILPKMREGGVIIFDDYRLPCDQWSRSSVRTGVDAFLQLANGVWVRELFRADQVAVEVIGR